MTFITYCRDVTIEGESGGPHYRAGYQVDVSPQEARAAIARGDAWLGKRKIPEKILQKETPKEDDAELPVMPVSRRKWAPKTDSR